MSPDIEEFRSRLLTLAKLLFGRSPKIESEASTNASLVQPFLTTLGYDVGNPEEVCPEHHMDFAEKYQNKVDYAILSRGVPVIAIESKRVGTVLKNDQGQLRRYFNACPTVKLGILTDGLTYEFYADSDKPNMMDEAAFLKFDLAKFAKDGSIDDSVLDGVAAVRSGSFNPQDVGAEAKRKLLFESIVETVKQFKTEPSDDFVRFVLGNTPIGSRIGKLTQRIVDANRDLVKSAMEAFVAREALARFGFTPKDVVKTIEKTESTPVPTTIPEQEPMPIGPTESETDALNYAKNRLFFLVRSEVLFLEVQKIYFSKSKTSFRVYYGRRNSGSIFDYREHRDGTVFIRFPALESEEFPFERTAQFDEFLLKAFVKRVSEAGVSIDAQPVLRSIRGGNPTAQ